MTKRRALVVAGGVALTAALVAWWLVPGSRLDREHFGQVRAGMTRAEVESLLGPPRNEWADRVTVWRPRDGKRVSAEVRPGPVELRFFPDAGGDEAVWIGRAEMLAARFDADGRVQETYASTVHGPDDGPASTLRSGNGSITITLE